MESQAGSPRVPQSWNEQTKACKEAIAESGEAVIVAAT